MCTAENLIECVSRLSDDEMNTLWNATQRGFRVSAYPSKLLLEIHLLVCCLEDQASVILLPRRGEMWKAFVSVPDLSWLPAVVQRFVESGGLMRRVLPMCGVISGLVNEGRAEAVARGVLTLSH